MLFATCCWLYAIGYVLPAVCCWLYAIGCMLLAYIYLLLDTYHDYLKLAGCSYVSAVGFLLFTTQKQILTLNFKAIL